MVDSRNIRAKLVLLIIGEILILLSFIGRFGIYNQASHYVGYVGFLIIPGLICNLFGILGLKDELSDFKEAFYGLLVYIVLALAALIVLVVSNANNGRLDQLVGILYILSALSSVFVTLKIIRGCQILVKDDPKQADYSNLAFFWYAATVFVTIVLELLMLFPYFKDRNDLMNVFTILVFVINIIAEGFFVVLLFRTHHHLAE